MSITSAHQSFPDHPKNEKEQPADGCSFSKREGISYWVIVLLCNTSVKKLGSFHIDSIARGMENVQQKFLYVNLLN